MGQNISRGTLIILRNLIKNVVLFIRMCYTIPNKGEIIGNIGKIV